MSILALRQNISGRGFRPREGYGLCRCRRLAGLRSGEASVPVRGMGCVHIAAAVIPGNYASVPVRGMGCVGAAVCPDLHPAGFRPREGYGLCQDILGDVSLGGRVLPSP